MWARLESWLGEHVPHIVAGLAPPADALDAAQARLGRALPAELRALLSVHNGGPGVIGGWDLCLDVTVGQVFRYCHDDDHEPPIAAGAVLWRDGFCHRLPAE